ncbi:uncharacterized protein KY384_003823 [Bacidia gigantensis]|uniref:uncharacterized protein n=1 Tax=Bacidia gigantensis TaxID=2732470 RepID=UPI001D046840|nr:uncharacterized protein KY384_003823 [Bacidia gigantensis]KAG8532183.1 hypothetical protein KY384_003823 [Bacidia gigantensis]
MTIQRMKTQATQQQQIQQQQHQQQQHQQQQHQRSVHDTANHPMMNLQSAALVNDATSDGQSVDGVDKVDGSAQKQNAMTNVNFSEQQMSILKTQMFAFKLLQKNNPIPPQMQQQLFKSQQPSQPQTKAEKVAKGREVVKNVERGSPEPQRRQAYEYAYSPFGLITPTISYSDHAMRKNRLQVNSIMPKGVDTEDVQRERQRKIAARIMDRRLALHGPHGPSPVDGERLREERDRIAYNRIQARKADLEGLPANMNVWDTSKSDEPSFDDTLKRKALIEYKMLCLLPKQRALRQQVHRDLIHYDNLAQTANRSQYRRQKKTSLREARITEKLEKQQRDQRETNEKQKQRDHLVAILNHGVEIHKSAEAQRQRQQKLGRLMLQQHQNIEKEEQKRVERTAKQRLQALKNDDEETYLKLLGQAKDSRISHLLKQTDGFLNQLAASVKAQQRDAGAKYYRNDADDSDDSEDDVEATPKVDYYEVAHRIKEEVKNQPTNLVGGTLKEYQVKGLQWMVSLFNNNLNGILADEMGLGKTIQTISLLTYLKEFKGDRGGGGPFLVIVPLSTLTNWNLEFEKWAPSLRRIIYKGPPPARKQQQQQIRYGQFDVLLTTYEYIIKDRPVLSRIKWIHMIVDEGHRMKNSNSKLSQTLSQYYQSRYRLILTGTPLQNNLPELWSLLNFVLPNIFKSVKSFDEWFNTPFANTGNQDRMELSEEEQLLVIRRLHKVLRPFLLRRLKKDVEKDLPDKQERVIKCRFSALQAKIYHQLITFNKINVSDGKGGKTGIRGLSNMLMQLRKLCNHPFVFEQVEDQMNPERVSNDLLWRTAGKFELLERVLPKFKITGHRVLIFFQMTQIMNIMEDFLRLKGLAYLRLDGSTKSDDRSELLAQFNDPNSPYFCFLLSTRAGGLGLNLQTADTVIIYDSDWNPHQDLQAQDRAHRIGQKNEVRILRLISSNSVEEKILERAQYKLDMDGKVIQAGRFDNKSTNEERDALLKTLLETAEAAEEMANQEEMDDDDLNMIMARTDAEMELFQRIDAERAAEDAYGNNPGQIPRLLGEDELPDIYMQEDNPVTDELEEIVGRGARERTKVKYDDGLTEEQWLDAVDNDEDTIEDAIARKTARKLPEPSRESSIAPASKKRIRKPTGAKRKAEEPLEEESAISKRKRGNKAVETLSAKDRSSLQKILNDNFQSLMELEERLGPNEEDARGLIDPFLKPVPRNQYPQYYLIIKDPICMEQVEKKINKKEYQSLKEYRDDIGLLCDNARTFNDDGSILFSDANEIESHCIKKLADETAEYPEWQNFDGDTPADGRSTAAMSSTAGTPMPGGGPNGGTKLKLTFNGNRDTSVGGGGYNGGMSEDE